MSALEKYNAQTHDADGKHLGGLLVSLADAMRDEFLLKEKELLAEVEKWKEDAAKQCAVTMELEAVEEALKESIRRNVKRAEAAEQKWLDIEGDFIQTAGKLAAAEAEVERLEAKDREHYECWKKDMAAWKADRERAEAAEAEVERLKKRFPPLGDLIALEPADDELMANVREFGPERGSLAENVRVVKRLLAEVERLKKLLKYAEQTSNEQFDRAESAENKLANAESMMSLQLKQLQAAEADAKHYKVCRDIEIKLRDKAEAEVELLKLEVIAAEGARQNCLDQASGVVKRAEAAEAERDEARRELRALKRRRCDNCAHYDDNIFCPRKGESPWAIRENGFSCSYYDAAHKAGDE